MRIYIVNLQEKAMNKRDVLELRRRLKKDTCTITRVAGCYVDANKHKVLNLNETFLNLPDDEFYKYLEIAKKTLGGTIGNNILELDFEKDEEYGGKQQFFMGLRASALKDEGLLDRLYDLIIEGYENVGNYIILVFHDSYDIISRTTDKQKLDESEEVYEYLLVAICPVDLSKAGLSYRQDENRIGARLRDWVVGAPALGFLFPAFNDGGADVNKVDYFVKDAKDSNADFIEEVIGCGPRRTKTEQRKTFTAIVKKAFGKDEQKGEDVLTDIQESFMLMTMDEEEGTATSPVLDARVIDEVLRENEVEEEAAKQIKEVCLEEFADEAPHIESLVDEKSLKKNMEAREKREMVKEIGELRRQLSDATGDNNETEQVDVILKVKPAKAELIKSTMIDGEKYILIPIDDDEQLKINGEKKDL